MTDKPTYEELLIILEPVYLAIYEAIKDNHPQAQRQWAKERCAHLASHGWTDEEFYACVDASRIRKFKLPAAKPLPPPGLIPSSAGVPLGAHTRAGVPPPQAQVPSCQGSSKVEAWFNLHKYKGQNVTYVSRNRRHTFTEWNGYEVTVTCFDDRSGKRYWSCSIGVGPNTKVVDAVRTARIGANA